MCSPVSSTQDPATWTLCSFHSVWQAADPGPLPTHRQETGLKGPFKDLMIQPQFMFQTFPIRLTKAAKQNKRRKHFTALS